MAYDFLPQFQKTHTMARNDGQSGLSKTKVRFLLDFPQEGATVTVVDEAGKPVSVDYRQYQGETFNVLRMLDTIRQERAGRVLWGESAGPVRLHDYPYLLFALMRCDNLVDRRLRPLQVSDRQAQPLLRIEAGEGPDGQCQPQLLASCEGEAPQPLQLLYDVFALVGTTIHPVASLGVNYRNVGFFAQPFPRRLMEQYLSVFFSFVDNVGLDFEDYQLERSEQTITTVPTIIIEKVDADMALYLRMAHTLPGFDADFAEQFDLTWQARLEDMERQVVLRRIVRGDEQEQLSALHRTIVAYAPTKIAAREVWQGGYEFIIPQETAGPFLVGALPELVKTYRLLGVERLKEYRVKPVKPTLKLNFSSGIDFLEGTATVSLEGEEMTLQQFLQQYGRQKYVTLADGNRALVDEGYVRRLERLFRKAGKGGGDRVRVSFFDLPEVENLLQQRLEGEAFSHHRQFYEGFAQLPQQRLRTAGVKAQLRNYQKEGVKWLNYLYENNMGACLADDMGLGKTLQTITMLTRVYPKQTMPSLIVMPRSLLFNWQDELDRFAPQLTYYVYYGPQRSLSEAMKHQLVLTTYALVRNDTQLFQQQQFHYAILDESQNIKNLSSQATQAVLLLNARHRLALSGTPIENNLSELYSLFRFLNPAMLGSAEEFNRTYATPIQHDADKDMAEQLRRKIFPFILRRLKKDVLKELPDRTEQTLYVEMDDGHQRYYEERRRYYEQMVGASIKQQGVAGSHIVLFQALSELRRIASVPESLTDGAIASPKLALLIEQLQEAVAGGHKVVVFFNFIAGIELVGDRLTELGIDYATMTGSTHDRRAVVERFQNDSGCKVLLMTLKTGGVGLNLTVADTVYIFEPWWNKAAEEQAINRLHRIGQKAKVMSYALITRDTIEEKIRQLQLQKKDLADSLIQGDSAMAKQLTEDDIKYILG